MPKGGGFATSRANTRPVEGFVELFGEAKLRVKLHRSSSRRSDAEVPELWFRRLSCAAYLRRLSPRTRLRGCPGRQSPSIPARLVTPEARQRREAHRHGRSVWRAHGAALDAERADALGRRPGRGASLKIALWGGRTGPEAKEVAFLDRLLNDLGRLEELARTALAESPEREKWPESARRPTFTLAEVQADEDEEGVFVLTFTCPEDPEAEYFVDFSGGTVEGVSRY